METKFVIANGLRFGYLEQGTGPLVLLLHGFPDTAFTWDQVLPALAGAGYRAIAPFMRGYHPTEIPDDGAYDSDTLGKDAVALVDAFSRGEPVILVGHDWGASAAYAAAAIAPACVRLLITLAIPHPRSIKPTPKLVWSARHFLSLRGKRAHERLARDDFAYLDRLVKRWSPAWNVPAGETARVKAAFREPGCAAAACAYYRAQSLRLHSSHRRPIAVPTVAFAGIHGTVSPQAFEKARHCFAASYEVVQVPGGHFMHREHPEEFAKELVRVIKDHDRAR